MEGPKIFLPPTSVVPDPKGTLESSELAKRAFPAVLIQGPPRYILQLLALPQPHRKWL